MSVRVLAAAALITLWAPPAARAAEDTPQSLQTQCDARNWKACDSLAFRYEQGEGVAEDLAKAGALYERACDAGFGESCANQAALYDGEKLVNDAAKILRLNTRSCALKAGIGCYQLGLAYLNAEGVPTDVGRGMKLLEQSCQLEHGDACFELYMLLHAGKVIAKDLARADVFYERACDLYATFCVMFFNEVFQPLVKECEEKNAVSCTLVGGSYLNGEAYLTVDEAKAAEYFLKGCNAGAASACSTLGWILDLGEKTPRDAAKAAGWYQKGCTRGHVYGCQMLGILYLNGEGVAKDPVRAADFFRIACNANISDAAAACGFLSELTKDPARAAALRAQACKLGDKYSCTAPAAPAAMNPAIAGCSVVKVQIGSDTAASVQRDITRRGGSASAGTNNGRPTLNAMSGDYADAGASVMSVNYTFETSGPTGRLIGLTIVNHANSANAFEKLLAARQAAAATVSSHCSSRLVPNADTWFIYEIYELK